jgi:hypothetical protein
MPVMLERWNDDKMDALAATVDVLAVKVDGVEVELREMREELRDIRRAINHSAIGLSGLIVLGFATVIAAVPLGA